MVWYGVVWYGWCGIVWYDMVNFSEGLMCLSIEWKLYTCRNSNREQLRKIHQLYRSSGRNRTYACAMPVHWYVTLSLALISFPKFFI